MSQTGTGARAGAPRGWYPEKVGPWPATPPRTGKMLETPPRFWVPILAATFGLSAVALWLNKHYLQPGSQTLTPEYIEATKALGDVSQRTVEGAQPVYRNPIRNRIPGYVLGPDDLQKAYQ